MTDYTKSTNFATKDALSSGNALKIVKGTELNTEFDNIQTAISTKADLASPTLTGTPSLPTGTTAVTQSYGNSSTLLATTAFVQAALSVVYPIGSVYINAGSSVNPATLMGFGTWVAYGAGRVMIGHGGGFVGGNTGGSADAVVVSHTHTATVTDGGHFHDYYMYGGGGGNVNLVQAANASYTTAFVSGQTQTKATGVTVSNSTSGVSGTNANLQPYIVAYMWQRTA